MGKIYARCNEVFINFDDAVKTASTPEQTDSSLTIRNYWSKRWADLDSPLHAAGYCLDLEFWGQGQHLSGDIMNKFRMVLDSFLGPEKAAKAIGEWLLIIKKEGVFGQENMLHEYAA